MSSILICRHCGFEQTVPSSGEGRSLRCVRCGALVKRLGIASPDTLLAWTLAALLMWYSSNFLPFLNLEYKGASTTAFISTGSEMLWSQGYYLLAVVVVIASVIAPLLHLSSIGVVLLAIKMGFQGSGVIFAIRFTQTIHQWAMPGIYMIGVLVASVKIGQMASLSPGPGLFALVAMVLIWTSISASLETDALFAYKEERS